MERLQKVIAAAGVCSRRAAERLIVAGRVSVNGEVVTELGTTVKPDDVIAVDGQVVPSRRRLRYVMLNKPAGFVTTRRDPAGRPTVYDLLFESDAELHTVGRLDRDTTGLLLLTNDGALTYRLTHPRYEVTKTYRVWTRPWPKPELLKSLRAGVMLEDGPAVPQRVSLPAPDCLELVLVEGRHREVRRMIEALGLQVLLLRRVALGPLSLGRLKEGKARPLSPREVLRLRAAAGLAESATSRSE